MIAPRSTTQKEMEEELGFSSVKGEAFFMGG